MDVYCASEAEESQVSLEGVDEVVADTVGLELDGEERAGTSSNSCPERARRCPG